jgi:hypothetical protein
MTNGGNAANWRRYIVDVLIAASTVAFAFAAIDARGDVLYTLLLPIALIGAGLALEPDVTAPPWADPGPQSFRLPAEIVEATNG